MFCTNCGAKIEDGAKFCEYCGTPQQVAVQAQPQNPQMQVPPTMQTPPPSQIPYQATQNQAGQIPTQPYVPAQQIEQKDTFYVRKLPMVMIVVMTIGLIITSLTMGAGSMTIAMLVCCIQGIVLIVLIYKLDSIEPEPVGLLVKLFLFGAILVPIGAMIVEEILQAVVNFVFWPGTILNNIATAFIVAAFTEEMGKYLVLKKLTWKHPAFNYRFDGIVYSTTVAIGFEVIENLLYLLGSDASTAYLRTAFPGHCIFGIYMGYYYGQAKSLEMNGDIAGSAKMRRKGVIAAITIHGIYDAVAMISDGSDNDLLIIGSLLVLFVLMCVLNVNAYKNIKKFAHEDRPV